MLRVTFKDLQKASLAIAKKIASGQTALFARLKDKPLWI
jgi:hypothetical protein